MRLFDANARFVTGGQFSATITADATGPESLILREPVMGTFDDLGRLVSMNGGAIDLVASDLLTPTTTAYQFVIDEPGVGRVGFIAPIKSGQSASDANVTVAADLVTVTLNNFVPSAAMIGATVTGTNVQAGTTITAINNIANTVTLSKAATAAGTMLQLTIGNTVDFRTLALGYLP